MADVAFSKPRRASCQQRTYGVGLMASNVRMKNETVEATDVYAGGQPDSEPRLGVRIIQDVPLTELPERIAAYLRETDGLRLQAAVVATG